MGGGALAIDHTTPAARRAAVAYYVHVPFCAAHCWYCDYPVVVGRTDVAQRLVDALLAEVRALRAALADRPVAALYVGGGTPSLLPPAERQRLLAGLTAALHGKGSAAADPAAPSIEYTFEVNPEDVTPELLHTCAAAGVNRLSVGAQSFDDRTLRRLGRRSTGPEVAASLELAARKWRGRLNVDLLIGAPGQRPAEAEADVDRVADAGVDHVTLLQLEEPPPGGPQPSADAERMWLAAGQRLRRHGYHDYEVTHFARGAHRSRYLCHTLRLQPVAAAGPGAVATVPAAAAAAYGEAAESDTGAVRVVHTGSPERYLAARGRDWGCTIAALSARDLLIDYLLHGLRLADGVPAAGEGWWDPSPSDLFADQWARWQPQGLARRVPGRLAFTARGRLRLDALVARMAERLDEERPPPPLAAAWPDGRG